MIFFFFFGSMAYLESKKSLHTWGTSIRPQYHTRICQEVFVGIWITPNKSTTFTENRMVTAENKSYCCADSTPGFKSITVNKRKLNNKHTQKHKNLRGSANCLPPRKRRRNFTIKIGRYNSAQEHTQETQILMHLNSLSPTRQENTILLLMWLLLGF